MSIGFLREAAGQKQERPRSAPRDEETGPLVRRAILCRQCRARLSDRDSVFSMAAGAPGGVFVNPHGIVHEILTVRRATNVSHLGPPTAEFTWFPGYLWEIALCGGCGGHVGWRFLAASGADPATFWALRTPAILEE